MQDIDRSDTVSCLCHEKFISYTCWSKVTGLQSAWRDDSSCPLHILRQFNALRIALRQYAEVIST